MTIEDAIKSLEENVEYCESISAPFLKMSRERDAWIKALELAIAALRAQQEAEKKNTLKTTWETPESCQRCMEHLSRDWSFCPECGRPTDWSPNDPLTLDELRKMGGEPYWHVGLQEDSPPPHWSILDAHFAQHIEDYGYGERWLAYRRKPKEDAK
jgi:hypothetical protein